MTIIEVKIEECVPQ
jgi:hypothetical protein